MSKDKRNGIGDELAIGVFWLFAWAWYVFLLVGAFGLGFWLTPYVSDGVDRETVGILGAMALVWAYERDEARRRWDRLNERIDQIMFPPSRER